jgi:hypothetical protein
MWQFPRLIRPSSLPLLGLTLHSARFNLSPTSSWIRARAQGLAYNHRKGEKQTKIVGTVFHRPQLNTMKLSNFPILIPAFTAQVSS